MKQIFDDNGLRYLELEFLMDWFLDPGDERRQASDRTRELLFDAAAELDAHHIKVGNIPGTPACELPQLTERFGELCADAAEHTDAKIVYEFMPFDVNVKSIDDGARGRRRRGRRERRHRDRHLAHVEARHPARRPAPHPARVPVVGRAERRPLREHGRSRSTRSSTTATCPARASSTSAATSRPASDHGYPGPWGVEVLSEELRNNPIDVIFRRAYEATAAQFGPERSST